MRNQVWLYLINSFLLFIAEKTLSLEAFVAKKALLVSQHQVTTFSKICSY